MYLGKIVARLLGVVLLGSGLLFSGCLSTKSYLEPQFRGVALSDITPPAAPRPATLTVTGQTNGKENKNASTFWHQQVERTLTTSKCFRLAQAGETADTITVTINNVADMGAAFGKGFATGLTFGAAGSTVTDNYVMTLSYQPAGKDPVTRTYRHSIHTTIGNAKGPAGLTPVTIQQASTLVAEEMILHFLKDLQAGLPPQNTAP